MKFSETEDAPFLRLAENFGCQKLRDQEWRADALRFFELILRHRFLIVPRQPFLRLAGAAGWPQEAREILKRNLELEVLEKERREGPMDWAEVVPALLEKFRAAALIGGMPVAAADIIYDLVAELLGAGRVQWLSVPDQASFLADLLEQAASQLREVANERS